MHFKSPFFLLNPDLDGAGRIFRVFLFGVMGLLILTYFAMIAGIIFWSLFFFVIGCRFISLGSPHFSVGDLFGDYIPCCNRRQLPGPAG